MGLAIIKNPNTPGLQGKYIRNYIDLGDGQTNLGLPNFVRSYLYNGFQAEAGEDSVVCSGQVYQLGAPAESGVAYHWQPSGHLSDANIAGPVFQYNNSSDSIQEFEYILTASDEVCFKHDTVKIKVYPLPPEEITGSRSVCPGVVAVAYSVPRKETFSYQWEVEGGAIAAGQGTAEILVDWGPTNPEAKVTVTAVSHVACETSVIGLPVRINVELDTEKPHGSREVCYNQRQQVAYALTNTNGSVYTWGVSGGAIRSGQGTHQVQVEWEETGAYKIWVNEESITVDTICYGTSDTLEVVVYKDTSEIALDYVSISLQENGYAEVQVKAQPDIAYGGGFMLYRRAWGATGWEMAAEASNENFFFSNGPINSGELSFEYMVSTKNFCNEPISSLPHRTILLSGEAGKENNTISLQWNKYEGWKEGVEKYEVWRRVDDDTAYQLVETLGPELTAYQSASAQDGFLHRYRIKAIENSTNYTSWSNQVELEFVHDIMIPNVFTPNGDTKNETFNIPNLELYPDNELVVMNRWGEEVFRQMAYKGEWNGENVSSGVYYYYFTARRLNKRYKGWVHIIK